MIASAIIAALAGWLAGAALNWLARWLPTRRDGHVGHVANLPHRELALQAAAALLALALWLRYGLTLALLPAGVTGLLLLLIAAIDLDRRLVLNEVLIAGSALALLNAALGGWTQLLNALLGGALALGVFILVALLPRLIIRSGTLMGVGDIKLAGLIGLLFGNPAGLQALLLGVMIGGVVSAALLLTRRLSRKTLIPYAPFLAAGGIAMLFWGKV